MTTIATTALDDEEQATLDALLETLIPSNPDLGLPSARGMPVVARLEDEKSELKRELQHLAESARASHGAPFASLDGPTRAALVESSLAARPFFSRLMHATLTVYYMDDDVMAAHGLAPRPPFPEGNEVVAGDLALLDPVKVREPFYRPA